MHAASETLLVRDTLQKTRELPALIVGQRGKQGLLVFTRGAADRCQGRASLIRQVQRITATIARILAPLGESMCLQFVKQPDQPAWDRSKSGGERLLRDRRSRIKDPEDAGMRRSKLEFGQTFAKL